MATGMVKKSNILPEYSGSRTEVFAILSAQANNYVWIALPMRLRAQATVQCTINILGVSILTTTGFVDSSDNNVFNSIVRFSDSTLLANSGKIVSVAIDGYTS